MGTKPLTEDQRVEDRVRYARATRDAHLAAASLSLLRVAMEELHDLELAYVGHPEGAPSAAYASPLARFREALEKLEGLPRDTGKAVTQGRDVEAFLALLAGEVAWDASDPEGAVAGLVARLDPTFGPCRSRGELAALGALACMGALRAVDVPSWTAEWQPKKRRAAA